MRILSTIEPRISWSLFYLQGLELLKEHFRHPHMDRLNEGIYAPRRRETWEGLPPCASGDPNVRLYASPNFRKMNHQAYLGAFTNSIFNYKSLIFLPLNPALQMRERENQSKTAKL